MEIKQIIRKWGEGNAPCLNCNERVPGCHGSCERYQQFAAQRQSEREARSKYLKETDALVDIYRQGRRASS